MQKKETCFYTGLDAAFATGPVAQRAFEKAAADVPDKLEQPTEPPQQSCRTPWEAVRETDVHTEPPVTQPPGFLETVRQVWQEYPFGFYSALGDLIRGEGEFAKPE